MSFGDRSLNIIQIGLFLLLPLFIVSSVSAQSPELVVRISDTADYPGEDTIGIPVYIANYNDSIAGFIIRFTLSNDLVSFQPSIITAGTLIEDWEFIDVRPASDAPLDLQVTAMADAYFPPIHTPAFPPQAGQKLLFKLLLDIAPISDTVTDRTAIINIIPDIAKTNFSTSDFQLIGLVTDTTYDTLWFDCASWFFDSCVTWVQVSEPPADYMYVDTNIQAWLDTTIIFYDNGSLTVNIPVCGDINDDLEVDISDITAIISFLYLGGDPPVCMITANVDGSQDGTIDISDITRLIQHLYLNGTPLACANLK